jgi:pilus assembly protein CpaC
MKIRIYDSMKIFLLTVACMVCMTGTLLAAAQLPIEVNQSFYLSFASALTRVSVANPEIADINLLSKTELIVVGKKSGTTSLILWTEDGMRQDYYVTVQDADKQTAASIQQAIHTKGIIVEKLGDNILLRGTVENQDEKNNAEKIAEMYGKKVVNLLQMTNPTQVRIEAQIVEISLSDEKKIGIQYANASAIDTTSGIVTLGTTGSFAAGQSFTNHLADINATIQALVTNGDAKVLSRPHIVTMSGEKASILIGGEIPIPSSNDNGKISVDWREYGIKLNIEPTVDKDDNITSKIQAEVSTLDYAHEVTTSDYAIPALSSRKAESVINVPSGMTMAIGGLISSDESKTITKVPLLGDLPVIGQFFRHTANTKEKKELIILITPTLVNENTPVAMTQDMKQIYNQEKKTNKEMEQVKVNAEDLNEDKDADKTSGITDETSIPKKDIKKSLDGTNTK